MASNRELFFWKKQAGSNALINAIRIHRERAIRFFGAVSVLSENEAELYRTLEAYTIIATSARDMQKKMNQIPEQLLSEPWQDFHRQSVNCLEKNLFLS